MASKMNEDQFNILTIGIAVGSMISIAALALIIYAGSK